MKMPNSEAIKEIYQDEDGWWIQLKPGYVWATMDNAHVVNGENLKQLREAMKEVKKTN